MSHFCLEFVELYERLVGHFFFFSNLCTKGICRKHFQDVSDHDLQQHGPTLIFYFIYIKSLHIEPPVHTHIQYTIIIIIIFSGTIL